MTPGEPILPTDDRFQGSYQPTAHGGPVQPPFVHRPPSGPDWSALADRHAEEASRRRRSWLTIGAVCGAFVLGTLTGGIAVKASESGPASGTVASGQSSAPAASDASSAGTPSSAAPTGPTATAPGAPTAPLPPGVQRLDDADGQDPLGASAAAQIRPRNGSKVLLLPGSAAGYAATAAPVVDTGRSFSVSAWVVNKAATGGRAVVSQGDGAEFSFDLGRDYWPKHNMWVFKVQTAAGGQDGTTYAVYSKANASVNAWVQLTGTYDAASRTIALYVNGVLQSSIRITGIWQTSGPLQLGRNRYKGQWSDFWDGTIAHVQVWDRALTATEAAGQLHDKSGQPTVHSWLVS